MKNKFTLILKYFENQRKFESGLPERKVSKNSKDEVKKNSDYFDGKQILENQFRMENHKET